MATNSFVKWCLMSKMEENIYEIKKTGKMNVPAKKSVKSKKHIFIIFLIVALFTISIFALISLWNNTCIIIGDPIDSARSHNYYQKGSHIYYSPAGNWFELGCTEIENVDTKSFNVLSSVYAKDKNNVYSFWKVVEGMENIEDIDSFSIISKYFAKDKNNVYSLYLNNPLTHKAVVEKRESIDASTFIHLNGTYYRDKYNIYDLLYRVEAYSNLSGEWKKVSLDTDSFEMLSETHSKDKNYGYFHNEVVTNDSKNFEFIEGMFSKDSKYFYRGINKIDSYP